MSTFEVKLTSDSALGLMFWLRTAVFAQSEQREPQTLYGTTLILLFAFVSLDIISYSEVKTGLELIL